MSRKKLKGLIHKMLMIEEEQVFFLSWYFIINVFKAGEGRGFIWVCLVLVLFFLYL